MIKTEDRFIFEDIREVADFIFWQDKVELVWPNLVIKILMVAEMPLEITYREFVYSKKIEDIKDIVDGFYYDRLRQKEILEKLGNSKRITNNVNLMRYSLLWKEKNS